MSAPSPNAPAPSSAISNGRAADRHQLGVQVAGHVLADLAEEPQGDVQRLQRPPARALDARSGGAAGRVRSPAGMARAANRRIIHAILTRSPYRARVRPCLRPLRHDISRCVRFATRNKGFALMSDFNRGFARSVPADRADMSVDAGLRSFMLGVYNKVALGLVLSAALAYLTGHVRAGPRPAVHRAADGRAAATPCSAWSWPSRRWRDPVRRGFAMQERHAAQRRASSTGRSSA